MNKACPLCKKEVDEELIKTCVDAEKWVIAQIRAKHPDWVVADGSCPKCLDYYRDLGKNK
jgi:protein-disulfide isomerase